MGSGANARIPLNKKTSKYSRLIALHQEILAVSLHFIIWLFTCFSTFKIANFSKEHTPVLPTFHLPYAFNFSSTFPNITFQVLVNMGKSKGKNNSRPLPSKAAQPIQQDSLSSELMAVDLKESELSRAIQCPVCKIPALSRCAGCNRVGYCSREHQKQHWKLHKNECSLYKVGESEELGRYLVATRDIKAGSVILQEKPLLLVPPRITTPICLGCYNELLSPEDVQEGGQDLRPCACPQDCGWPMCNTEACKANREDHSMAECKTASTRGGVNIRNFGQDHPMYQAVGILRALALRQSNPEAYNQLLQLQSNVKKHEERSQDGIPDIGMVTTLILNFFKVAASDVNDQLIGKICGILETNGHEIPLPGNYGQLNRRLIGVYNIASLLEHNCRPNCVKAWDSQTREIIIRASVPINKGDHLSISYVDPLWGTSDRQNFLQMTKFFTCKCSRCKDPTELDCHISSLRCQQIQCTNKVEVEEKSGTHGSGTGMIVPENPLDPESSWKCLTCSEVYPVKYAASIVEKIGREVEDFHEKRGDIAAEEEFLRKFGKTLASSHFYLLEVKVELAQLYGRTADEPLPMLPPLKLLRKRVLCEELVRVLNVILPGYNRLRALILYELQATIVTLSKLKFSCGDIPTKVHLEELVTCSQILSEVIKVLGWEPELSVEYRRCEGAKRELVELDALIRELKEFQDQSTRIISVPSSPQQASDVPSGPAEEFDEDLELF